jgi:hypothetical protein
MSDGLLSRMDHKETERDDMRYLVQPRGPGNSWVFRMLTPPDLIGQPNPWDGKQLGKEIKKGLATRHLPEALAPASRSRTQTPSAASPLSLGPMAQQWRPPDTIPENFVFQA